MREITMLSLKLKHKINPKKIAIVKELSELINSNNVIAIASLHNLRARQIQELRKTLSTIFILKVSKNALMKKAIDQCTKTKPRIKRLEEFLQGQNAFLFSNENPFLLAITLNKHKVLAEAKAGDKTPNDIIIPAGNTGITPGPLMSKFSAFKIPVKIEEGSIWVTKDTVAVKAGEKINPDLADLLKRLNIKPIEVKLSLKSAYYDGLIISTEELQIDLDKYRKDIVHAYKTALSLLIETSMITPESAPIIISKAVKIANYLAAEMAIPEPETLKHSIYLANSRAIALATKISQIHPELNLIVPSAATPVVASAEPKKEDKKKKEEKEEEVAEGLAALFG